MAEMTATAKGSRHLRGKAGVRPMSAAAPSAAMALLLWLRFGIHLILLPLIPWAIGLILLAMSDLERHLLPKRLTYVTAAVSAIALSIVAAAADSWMPLGGALLGSLLAITIYGTMWLAFPRSLGFGDVRLAALGGLMLGWFNPLLAIVALAAGQVLCLVALGALAATGRATRSTEMPLGVFLAIANIACVIVLRR
jgi:leader peptidase (prepilin peptidase)/N-methyltransferase